MAVKYAKEFFGLQLEFARKVSELAGVSFAQAVRLLLLWPPRRRRIRLHFHDAETGARSSLAVECRAQRIDELTALFASSRLPRLRQSLIRAAFERWLWPPQSRSGGSKEKHVNRV